MIRGHRDWLARISHQLSTAVPDPGMSTALRSVGLLDVLSSTPAAPSVARLVCTPVCVTSLQNLGRVEDERGASHKSLLFVRLPSPLLSLIHI